MFTNLNSKYYVRILTFNEIEITYSNSGMKEPAEIDIKSDRNHLEIKESGAELSITEGLPPNEHVNVETVDSIIIDGVMYNGTDLEELSKVMYSADDKDRGKENDRMK